MPGPEEAIISKLVTESARHLIRFGRRRLETSGRARSDIHTLLEILGGPHKSFSPLSIIFKLPDGATNRDIEEITETYEVRALCRQLLAAQIANADGDQRRRIQKNIKSVLADRLNKRGIVEGVKSYVSVFVEAVTSACIDTANEVSKRSKQFGETFDWASDELVRESLSAIASYTSVLSKVDDSEREDQNWIAKYKERYVEVHSRIRLPDVNTRHLVEYDRIYVEPTLRAYAEDTTISTKEDNRKNRQLVPSGIRMHELDRNLGKFFFNNIRTVILGDPGAGKSTSTLIASITLMRESDYVPFYLQLREIMMSDFGWKVIDEIVDLLSKRYQQEVHPNQVKKLLLEGRAIVVFDGLDELQNLYRRTRTCEIIETFSREYSSSVVLVTSRWIGYDFCMVDPKHFTTVAIEPFLTTQVQLYAKKWFTVQCELGYYDSLDIVEHFMHEIDSMKDLSSNPLLLAVMCLMYKGRHAIPKTRPRLYQECVDLLLGAWDTTRAIESNVLDAEVVQIALCRLAYAMLVENCSSKGMTSDEMLEILVPYLTHEFPSEKDARRISRELIDLCRGRAWMFTDVGLNEYHEECFGFTHSSFREYFCALYLIRTFNDTTGLAAELLLHIEKGEWEVLTQICIAVQNKNRAAGGSRVLEIFVDRIGGRFASGVAAHEITVDNDSDAARCNRVLQFAIRTIAVLPMAGRVLRPVIKAAVESMMYGFDQPIEQLLIKDVEFSETYSKEFYERIAKLLQTEARGVRLTPEGRRLCWVATQIIYKLRSHDQFLGHETAIVEFNRRVANDLNACLESADSHLDGILLMRLKAGSLSFRELHSLEFDVGYDDSNAALGCFRRLYYDTPNILGFGPRSVYQWIIDDILTMPRTVGRGLVIANFLKDVHDVMSSHSPSMSLIDIAPSFSFTLSDRAFDDRVHAALKRLLRFSRGSRSGAAILFGGLISLAEVHDIQLCRSDALLKESKNKMMLTEYGKKFVDNVLEERFPMWTTLYEDFGVS